MAYYQPRGSDRREQPPGCLDAFAITRALLGVLLWPVAFMLLLILGVAATVALYAANPWLALIPIIVGAAAIGAFVRWDGRRVRPPPDP